MLNPSARGESLSPVGVHQAARLLKQGFQIKLVNAEDIITGDEVKWSAFDLVLLITSTYGSGQPPASATRYNTS